MLGFADIKELITLMRQSDNHFQKLIKEIHSTNKLLTDNNKLLTEILQQMNRRDKNK